MSAVAVGSLGAFLVLVVITAVRAPSAIREPSSRLAWIATSIGCAALAMTGYVVPLAVLDSWLGGTNVANLLQNIFATIAFWFVMQAAHTLDGSRFHPFSLWQLPAMVLAFTIPFTLISERGPTDLNFIRDQADKPMLWAYASIYMACVAYVMLRLLADVRHRPRRRYLLMRIGSWLIVIACFIEIAYLSLRVVDVQPRWAVEIAGDAFVVPFYGGIVVAGVGLGSFAAATRTRMAVLVALRVLLFRANAGRGLRSEDHVRGDGAYGTYRLAVRLTDIANSQKLRHWEQASLQAAAYVLDRQMRAPAVVRMSSAPEGPR